MVGEVARVDRDRLVVLALLVLLAAAAGVEAVEEDLLPVDLALLVLLGLRFGLRRLLLDLALVLLVLLRLDHVEEGIVEELLLEVLLEVEQGHVEQIHRLVQARIDLELLLELGVWERPCSHATVLPCSRPREAGAQARRERRAEIDVGDGLVEHQLAHGARDLHLAVEHDVRAVHDIESLFHVVIADQHADAAMAEVGDDGLDVVHGDRVDPRERLVQHHEFRLRHQRPRDLEPAPLSAGELRTPCCAAGA